MTVERHAFVVGSGRSGTSLAKAILNLDPAVSLGPESHFLDQWLPRYWGNGTEVEVVAKLWIDYRESAHFQRYELPLASHDDLASAVDARSFYATMLDAYAEEHGASVAGEKTAANFRYVGRLLEWFPDGRVAFLVRDPRGVVASLAVLDATWASGSLASHVSLWRDAARAALRWRTDERVEIVRYEDLVTDPATVIPTVHRALTGRPFDLAWLDDLEADGRPLSTGSLTVDQGLQASRTEAWRGRLTEDQLATVLRSCAAEMRALGYDVEVPRASVTSRVIERGDVVRLQGQRLVRAVRHPGSALRRIRYRRAGG